MDIQQTLVPYLESRTDFYEMLHKLYRWPLSEEELEALDEGSFQQLAEELEPGLMSCGFNDMYRALRRRNTGTRQVLCADFTKVFLGTSTYEGFSAQPYASLFCSEAPQLMGAERTAVSRIYRENAVQLSEGIDLPEDHLAFECEFLAIVNRRAAEALAAGDEEEARAQLALQYDFLQQHVLNWFPRFYALAQKMADTRFYRGVLRLTKGFFEESVEVIPQMIEEIAVAQPSASAAE